MDAIKTRNHIPKAIGMMMQISKIAKIIQAQTFFFKNLKRMKSKTASKIMPKMKEQIPAALSKP